MSNSGKVWDTKEVYKKQMNSSWSKGDIGVTTNSNGTTIEKIQISTTGNATAFGDITTSGNETGGAMAGNQTRLLFSGGNQPTTSNVICYKEFSFDGNFVDFGDLSGDRQLHAGASNGLRAAFAGGRQNPGSSYTTSNRMDVSTFASLGNAIDFGDLTVARFSLAAMQSPTRALYAGGSPAPSNTIDFVTWSSLGNATDFGDISTSTTFAGFGGSSSETRGVFGGGGNPSNPSIIDFVTMASQGNSGDFGDLSVNRLTNSAAGNSNRICFFGGQSQPSTASVNTIDFVNIATRGNATDFGDMTSTSGFKISGHSNGHGGIGLGEFQRPSVTYMPGSGRSLVMCGTTPTTDRIDLVFIPTSGAASDFGDAIIATRYVSGASSATNGIYAGGGTPSLVNTIAQTKFATQGNAFDFGDLSVSRTDGMTSQCGSATRGLFINGITPSATNVIDYITFATVGNATDFGDSTDTRYAGAGLSSSTRGIYAGGAAPSPGVIDYTTIASTGNATDFGDTTAVKGYCAGASNGTRGLVMGGASPSIVATIDYITIASTGNAQDFGDLSVARSNASGTSNSIRGMAYTGRTPSITASIDFVTIASLGNGTDYGDLGLAREYPATGSDSHGGLQA